MNSKRVYYGMLGLIILLCVAIGVGAYGIQSLLTQQSTNLVKQKAEVQSLSTEQTQLTESKKEVAADTDLYDIARVVVPENKDQAETVRQIVKLAGTNNIKLGSITFPSSTLGGTAPGSTTTPSTTTPAPANSPSSSLSQLTKVPQIPGVYQLQITIASDSNNPVSYSQLINFLKALENNRLTAQVSSVTINPNSNNSALFDFQLIVNIYIKP